MKEASDPKLDGFMRVEEVVECLATGWGLRSTSADGWDSPDYFVTRSAGKVRTDTLHRLMKEGWIDGNNGYYYLTEAGRKSYLRSTDEMGDGKLLPPNGDGE